jgi:hypothetical protein
MIRYDTLLYEKYTKWTKGTIRSLLLLGIVLAALLPRTLSSQFSDSTIKEINERLLELHKCRQKQSLYVKLAHNDSVVIHSQNDTIKELINGTNRQKVAIYRYQTYSIVTTLLVIALLL